MISFFKAIAGLVLFFALIAWIVAGTGFIMVAFASVPMMILGQYAAGAVCFVAGVALIQAWIKITPIFGAAADALSR